MGTGASSFWGGFAKGVGGGSPDWGELLLARQQVANRKDTEDKRSREAARRTDVDERMADLREKEARANLIMARIDSLRMQYKAELDPVAQLQIADLIDAAHRELESIHGEIRKGIFEIETIDPDVPQAIDPGTGVPETEGGKLAQLKKIAKRPGKTAKELRADEVDRFASPDRVSGSVFDRKIGTFNRTKSLIEGVTPEDLDALLRQRLGPSIIEAHLQQANASSSRGGEQAGGGGGLIGGMAGAAGGYLGGLINGPYGVAGVNLKDVFKTHESQRQQADNALDQLSRMTPENRRKTIDKILQMRNAQSFSNPLEYLGGKQ